jgi:hypothetical protein
LIFIKISSPRPSGLCKARAKGLASGLFINFVFFKKINKSGEPEAREEGKINDYRS